MSHRRICYCCDEECLILHDPLAGPELSSAWEIVSGDVSFASDYLRLSTPNSIILANKTCELGNVGLQITFKGYDRDWDAVDQATLIFDYHSPTEYKYAVIGLAPDSTSYGCGELRQVAGGDDVRLGLGTGVSNLSPGFEWRMSVVVEPDEASPGYYLASLSTPGLLDQMQCYRSCLSITSPVVGFGTGDLTRQVDFRDAYIWTPREWGAHHVTDCPRAGRPGVDNRIWVWLLEFDSGPSQGAYVVHFSSENYGSLLWRRPFGDRCQGGGWPYLNAQWDPWTWRYYPSVYDGHYSYYGSSTTFDDPYSGFALTAEPIGGPTYTCFARAIHCDEA
jgi:hypothetical protein